MLRERTLTYLNVFGQVLEHHHETDNVCSIYPIRRCLVLGSVHTVRNNEDCDNDPVLILFHALFGKNMLSDCLVSPHPEVGTPPPRSHILDPLLIMTKMSNFMSRTDPYRFKLYIQEFVQSCISCLIIRLITFVLSIVVCHCLVLNSVHTVRNNGDCNNEPVTILIHALFGKQICKVIV